MLRLLLAALLAGLFLTVAGYAVAVQRPVVTVHRVALPGHAGPPVRLALLADIHVAGPDMPPARLAGIVAQVNALGADCVLLAGDFVSDKMVATRRYSAVDAVRPLAALRAPALAVLGNHDHWRDGGAIVRGLRAAGVRLVNNAAARCGGLTVAGVDDVIAGDVDLPAARRAAARLGAPAVLLSHSPDVFAAATGFPLVLAGHTHCGQIALPGYGALFTAAKGPRRHACGRVDESGRTLIVSGGLGTSGVPLRLFTRPEILLVEVVAR